MQLEYALRGMDTQECFCVCTPFIILYFYLAIIYFHVSRIFNQWGVEQPSIEGSEKASVCVRSSISSPSEVSQFSTQHIDENDYAYW